MGDWVTISISNQDDFKKFWKDNCGFNKNTCKKTPYKRRQSENNSSRVSPRVRWASHKLNRLRHRAKRNGLEFNLNLDDIIQLMVETCPVMGVSLVYEIGDNKSSKLPSSPSFDRIDNSRGYVKGNVI